MKADNMPLKWHQECLYNQKQHLKSEEEKLAKLNDEVKRLREKTDEYATIVQVAEIRKMSEFPVGINLKSFLLLCKRIDAKRDDDS